MKIYLSGFYDRWVNYRSGLIRAGKREKVNATGDRAGKKDKVKGNGRYQDFPESRGTGRRFIPGGVLKNDDGVSPGTEDKLPRYRDGSSPDHAEPKSSPAAGFHFYHGTGNGVVSALQRYWKAAEEGDTDAQYHLGLMYANGTGVIKSVPAAIEWFNKAGMGYLEAGREEAAKTAFDRIRELRPQSLL